jgi:hypothetical protein
MVNEWNDDNEFIWKGKLTQTRFLWCRDLSLQHHPRD